MAIGSTLNTATMSLTFDDEFNTFSASPNGSTGLWRTTLANGDRTLGSNGEQEYYSDSSVGVNPFSMQNGALVITATPGSNALNLPYNSGVITTQNSFSQLYGYFEINAQMPAGQGLWPAFWMLPASGAWPPELDIFEVLGNAPSTLYFSTHSSVQATQGTTLNVANVSSGFNRYGAMWGPQTVDLYINGVEIASMATPADMNVPMYMLANLAVGGYWPGNPNSSTVFPATMKIDYVHAYAYPGTTGGTVYNTLPSQNVGVAAVAPTISAPAGFQTVTGVETHISGVSIAANWPGGSFTVMVSDNKGLLHTAPTTDVFVSGEGTTFLTLTGALPAINASLATLTYQGTATGNDWMWVGATNPQGQQGTASIVATDVASIAQVAAPPVVTTPPAGPPVVTAPAALTLAAGATQALAGIGVAGGQTGGTITVKISDSIGILHTSSVSGVTESGEDSTTLTLSGSLAAVSTELASLTYRAGSATGSDWLWVSANDSNGGQGIGHTVVTTTAASAAPPPATQPIAAPPTVASPTVAPASVPVVAAPTGMTVAAGVTQALTGINVTNSQAGGTFTVTVSDGYGLLSTVPVSGVAAHGQGSTSLKLIGSLAAIDAELASLTYRAGSNAGSDWLWVSASDASGNQGIGHTVVTVTSQTAAPPPLVTGVPVVTAAAGWTLAAGAIQTLSGFGVAGGQTSGTYSVCVSDSSGLLNIAPAVGVTVQGRGTNALNLVGSLAAINTELLSLTYQAGISAGSDWLWVSATDALGNKGLTHTVMTVAPSAVVPSPVTPPPAITTPVTTAPAAPAVTAPAASALAAGTTLALTGIGVASNQAGGIFSIRVSDSYGLLRTTAVAGVTEQGEGTASLTLTGSLAAVNTALSNLTYQATSAAGTDWLWISANDAAGNQGITHDVVTVVSTSAVANGLLTGPQTTVLAGSSLVGAALQIDGGRTLTNTGTLTWNGGTIALGSGDAAATNHTGTLSNAAGAVFAIAGDCTVTGTADSAIVNAGTVDVSAGTLTLKAGVTGNGTFLLHGLSTLDFAAAVGGGSTISFLSSTATLKVETLGAFGPTILGFAKGDTIDVAPVPSGLATMLNFVQTGSSGILTISDGAHTGTFNLTGSYNTAGFHMASDNHGGTAVTFT
jgi:beta-glucanase (GH16 family)